MALKFSLERKHPNGRGRVGKIETPHGIIETPAFIVVGTKAVVRSLTNAEIIAAGTQAVLANTYHLYLEPGEEILKQAGGFPTFMNWQGPTFTDSGGFQAFSLGAAFGSGVGKIASGEVQVDDPASVHESLAKVDEDGVTFKSIIDGSTHRFTPERSMEIQHVIGADIMFAFDECTSPLAPHQYQKEAMDRTHRWAKRSLDHHRAANTGQALFGIVQGGRFEDLRKESARTIGAMDFDGFGIGGSFNKDDLHTAVGWVADVLPEGKPRHLLGIGEPLDLILGMENGMDTFDCVVPTRIARHGTVYTQKGKIHMTNTQYRTDFGKLDEDCDCYTCAHHTRAYLSHLFRVHEITAAALASIHNVYFLVNLVKKGREAMLGDRFEEFKETFLQNYK